MKKPRNLASLGFHRVEAVVPQLALAKPLKNAERILKAVETATKNDATLVVFPELALTGYTCEDLFHTQGLLEETQQALQIIIEGSRELNTAVVVGLPWSHPSGRLYNCAAVVAQGKLLGLIPKTHLPNYSEFYERRWFISGEGVNEIVEIFDQKVPFTSQQVITINDQLHLGVEICEDLWAVLPPSTHQALAGANVIVNISASNELVGKADYRRELVKNQSARLNVAYIYVSAGPWESTKDVVFGGQILMAENGTMLTEGARFSFATQAESMEIDVQKIGYERRKNITAGSQTTHLPFYRTSVNFPVRLKKLVRNYDPAPFVPSNPETLKARTQEILSIQSVGLARRLRSLNHPKLVLGLSGGLDSTLALLVGLEALKINARPFSDLLALSLPGFGTSDRTRKQAKLLAQVAEVSFSEIDITASVREHFKALQHPESKTDVVYENSQARERTQILFDYANQQNAIVLGTGDLSELALGWCTYNGDHMSSYGVNASVPKTLVKFLVQNYMRLHPEISQEFKDVLAAIVQTKISPELLPTNSRREITQSTEDLIGPYRLHDFFLFYYLRYGFSQEKILYLASLVFAKEYPPATVEKWLVVFFKRFRQQQFKRTTLPAGPKVGSVSLSPRGDWRMPDETAEEN